MRNLYCSTKPEYRSCSNTYSAMQFKNPNEHLQVHTNVCVCVFLQPIFSFGL